MGAGTAALGLLIGTGGSIASGLVAQNEAESAASRARRRARSSRELVVSEQNPFANPLVANLVAQQLASLGVLDPSLIVNAGPLGQVREAIRAAGLTGQEQFGVLQTLDRLQREVESGEITPEQARFGALGDVGENFSIQLLGQFSPFGNDVGALLEAQRQFEESVQPVLQNLELIRETGLQRSQLVNQGLLDLTEQVAGGVDLDALREVQRERLAREIADRRNLALQRANAGGFNPGGDLEGLQELETDADLVALQRALGLVGAQQTTQQNALNLLTLLNPATPIQNPTALAPGAGTLANNAGANNLAAQLEAQGGFAAAQGAADASALTASTLMGPASGGAGSGGGSFFDFGSTSPGV